MSRPLLVALMALVALFAGCTDDGADKDGAIADPDATPGVTPDAGPIDLAKGIPAPVWHVGDWWEYKVDYTSGESFTAKLIVYKEEGSSYYVTSSDAELTKRAAFTHYPNIGVVKKDDLAQSIHGTDVRDFRFPMKNDTWTGKYRDFDARWNSTYTTLDTGKGPVPGFVTTMVNEADGRMRIANGWSPYTRWYTNFTFDFDGTPPVDVTYTLQDWGTDFTGTFPLVEILDGVHRVFPAVGVAPPDPNNPPGVPGGEGPVDDFTVGQEGASVLWAMFAASGGAGDFEFELAPPAGDAPYNFPYRPTAAGGYFAWGEIEDAPVGAWQVHGQGTAQFFAFLFLETYEARTTQGSLP